MPPIAAALAAEKAAAGRDLASAKVAELKGEPEPKGGKLKKLVLIGGLLAVAGVVANRLKSSQSESANWQSSYVPPPPPAPSSSTGAAAAAAPVTGDPLDRPAARRGHGRRRRDRRTRRPPTTSGAVLPARRSATWSWSRTIPPRPTSRQRSSTSTTHPTSRSLGVTAPPAHRDGRCVRPVLEVRTGSTHRPSGFRRRQEVRRPCRPGGSPRSTRRCAPTTRRATRCAPHDRRGCPSAAPPTSAW